jgi:hypothetical protein
VRGGRAGSEAGPPHVSRLPNPAASDGAAAEQHPARARVITSSLCRCRCRCLNSSPPWAQPALLWSSHLLDLGLTSLPDTVDYELHRTGSNYPPPTTPASQRILAAWRKLYSQVKQSATPSSEHSRDTSYGRTKHDAHPAPCQQYIQGDYRQISRRQIVQNSSPSWLAMNDYLLLT